MCGGRYKGLGRKFLGGGRVGSGPFTYIDLVDTVESRYGEIALGLWSWGCDEEVMVFFTWFEGVFCLRDLYWS